MLIFVVYWKKYSIESSSATTSEIVESAELLHAATSECHLLFSLAGEYRASKKHL